MFHNQPVLIVAPHLILPAIMGSDIVIERLTRNLSQHAAFVDLIGSDRQRRYRNAEIESEELFPGKLRTRTQAALRTLFFRSHYYYERFNTAVVRNIVRQQVDKENYRAVVASYLTSLTLVPPGHDERKYFAFTHNDEFKWFEDLGKSSANPLSKQVANLSYRWLRREVRSLSRRAVFMHISQNDCQGYERFVPGHRHFLTPVGTDVTPPPENELGAVSDKVILSFIGALGVRMALDALNHFRRRFEPALREAFGEQFAVRVIGSAPLPAIHELCDHSGWTLHANLPDAEFSQALAQSAFTVLPFAYATGAKLKLVRSLGSGVPFLSTLAAQPRAYATPPGCCFSDNPQDWVNAVRAWRAQADIKAARKKLLAVAQESSWPAVVSNIAQSMEKF